MFEVLKRSVLFKSIQVQGEMLEDFKELWFHEYLLGLKHLFKNLHQTNFVNRIKVGDIVFIKNPTKRDNLEIVIHAIKYLYPL